MEDISLFFSLKVIKLWEKQKQLYLVGSNGVVVDPLSIAVTSPHATSAYCTDTQRGFWRTTHSSCKKKLKNNTRFGPEINVSYLSLPVKWGLSIRSHYWCDNGAWDIWSPLFWEITVLCIQNRKYGAATYNWGFTIFNCPNVVIILNKTSCTTFQRFAKSVKKW